MRLDSLVCGVSWPVVFSYHPVVGVVAPAASPCPAVVAGAAASRFPAVVVGAAVPVASPCLAVAGGVVVPVDIPVVSPDNR